MRGTEKFTKQTLTPFDRWATSLAGIVFTFAALFVPLIPLVSVIEMNIGSASELKRDSASQLVICAGLFLIGCHLVFLCVRYTYRGMKGYRLEENKPISDAGPVRNAVESQPMHPVISDIIHVLGNLLQFPFRLVWNIFLVVGAIWLLVIWLGFVFGSVVGVIILLVFAPDAFLLPLGLLIFLVELWPDPTG